MARIQVLDHDVVWREFEQPHRAGKWFYEVLGEFTLDGDAHEAALADAIGAIPGGPPPLSE
jgi:hypothetical protein